MLAELCCVGAHDQSLNRVRRELSTLKNSLQNFLLLISYVHAGNLVGTLGTKSIGKHALEKRQNSAATY